MSNARHHHRTEPESQTGDCDYGERQTGTSSQQAPTAGTSVVEEGAPGDRQLELLKGEYHLVAQEAASDWTAYGQGRHDKRCYLVV
eukprot:3876490-Rhodomonas_salina.9